MKPRRDAPAIRESGEHTDGRATAWLRIGVSAFRGEDDFKDVCARHHKMAGRKFDQFCAHEATKDRFLRDPEAERERQERRRERGR